MDKSLLEQYRDFIEEQMDGIRDRGSPRLSEDELSERIDSLGRAVSTYYTMKVQVLISNRQHGLNIDLAS